MEIWKDIKGYKGVYQASNLGNVRSLDRFVKHYSGSNRIYKGKTLKGYLKADGYSVVRLSNKGIVKNFTIHQLVAMAFLNHKPNGHKLVVDHIDNNKLNNRLDNLQIISQRLNVSRYKKGVSKYTGVCWNKNAKKWAASIKIKGVKKHLGYFDCEIEASKAYKNKLKMII